MRILHDWDEPYLGRKDAIFQGIKLILYGICKWFMFKPKFLKEIYEERKRNLDTIIKLDKLVGINSVIGIRWKVYIHFPTIFKDLEKYDIDVREHIHIGDDKNPYRKREWIPELNQSRNTWHYDRDWIEGNEPKLKDGELPIWHIDYPKILPYYIDFLYEKLIEEN